MGGRSSYDSRRITGNSRNVKGNAKTLKESIEEKKPLDIAYDSAKLSVDNSKQTREIFNFLNDFKTILDKDKLESKSSDEKQRIIESVDKYSTKNKPITDKEKELLEKSLNRIRRSKK